MAQVRSYTAFAVVYTLKRSRSKYLQRIFAMETVATQAKNYAPHERFKPDYYFNVINENKKDSAKFWKTLKTMISNLKPPPSLNPRNLLPG